MKDGIKVIKVTTHKEMNDFLRLPEIIYRNIPQYVPDFESDVLGAFNEKTNPGLEFSDIQPFVAYRGKEVVGRIVGIVNRKANKKWKMKNVRFSMIEFIDDHNVSRALIETIEEWGRGFGMQKIHGPLGVTDFDKEGMLVEDFDLMGSMTAIYNPPYYPQHMEALGFEKEVDWQQVRIDIPEEVPAKYARVAQYARETIGLRVIKCTRDEIKGEMGQRAFKLFNQAYEPIFGFSELSTKQVDFFLKKYVSLIDMELIPIIENDKGEVVGAAVTMGSLTQALQKSKGRLLPMGWYHLLRSLKWKNEGNAEMLLIAIRPDYQGLGVNAMFFDDLIPIYNRLGIKWAETGPQLEDNIRELSQWKPLKPTFVKRRRCYVKDING
ncbi:MAG: N-acetyltransferase [Prevotella sp.]|nr:N-acetyltransferase [Prevotella sp.]